MRLKEKILKQEKSSQIDENETKATQNIKLPLRMRLMMSALSSFAISFTFIIFGIYDLYINNRENFSFIFKDIWLVVLITGMITFAVLTVIMILFRGKIFNTLISLAVGVLIAGYIQGNFLNLNLGQLTGDTILWHNYKQHTVFNILIWIMILTVPFMILHFNKPIWKKFCMIAPAFLILAQAFALTMSILSNDILNEERQGQYLSTQGIYEISSKENIIVFVLDRLDQNFINEILKEDPYYFDDLDGFTQYTNNTSYYCRTYPAVINLLTGYISYYDVPAKEFCDKAWGESTFLKDIRKNNYTTKLYMNSKYTCTDIMQLTDVADNVIEGEVSVDKKSILKNFIFLSAYRYAPHTLKPTFWITTNDFENTTEQEETYSSYTTDNVIFYKNMVKEGITVQSETNNFTYYHLYGSHSPVNMNENMERVSADKSSVVRQTKGCFNIIREYMNILKEKGLYENATIIITGDHGKSMDIELLDYAVTTGLFVKRKGSAGVPLKTSNAPVNADNFRASVIEEIGLDKEEYGKSYWEVEEDSDVVRKYYYRVRGTAGKSGFLEEFNIRGDANDFSNWEKIREIEILYPYG